MKRLSKFLWRGKLRKAATIVVGSFAVLVVIGAIASAFDEEGKKSTPPAASLSEITTPGPSETAESTETPKPTATLGPTNTATNTPTEQEECEEAGGTWHNHYFSFRGAECHPATPTPGPANPPTDAPTEQEECEEAGGTWHNHYFSFRGAECHPPTPTPEPTDTPGPSWETGPVTEETVREALDDLDNLGLMFWADINKDNITFLSVIPHWETDGYIVAIEFEPGTVWSETNMLTVAGESTLVAMAKLFANAEVDRVQISAMAELTDVLGNTNTRRVTTVAINRATADQINWRGFAERQLLDNKHIFCYADAFIIRPVIYNALEDAGCLPGPSRSEE